MPGRDPDALAPFGNAPRIGGADGVLSFGEKGKPKTALSVGFRGLELIAIGRLQSHVSVSDGSAVEANTWPPTVPVLVGDGAARLLAASIA